MRIIINIILIGISLNISAQEIIPPSKASTFVKIYFQEKEIPQIDDKLIQTIFQEHNISKDNFSNLAPQSLNNPTYLLFKSKLDSLENVYKSDKHEKLMEICQANNIDINEYLDIKNKYRNNLHFHRSLKPYFDNYIKSISNE